MTTLIFIPQFKITFLQLFPSFLVSWVLLCHLYIHPSQGRSAILNRLSMLAEDLVQLLGGPRFCNDALRTVYAIGRSPARLVSHHLLLSMSRLSVMGSGSLQLRKGIR